jgi:hypothetical protein
MAVLTRAGQLGSRLLEVTAIPWQRPRQLSAFGLLCGSRRVQVVRHDRLAVLVAGLAEDGGGVLAGGGALLEPAHLAQGQAEIVQRRALAVAVAGVAASALAAATGRA